MLRAYNSIKSNLIHCKYNVFFKDLILAIFTSYWLWGNYQTIAEPLSKISKRADLGATGDYFGGILNPIYAFLGLLMILISLYQNQRELKLSREEFRESNLALQAQAATLEQQRYEDTFFSLLEQHNTLVLKINQKDVEQHGEYTRKVEGDCELFKNIIFCGKVLMHSYPSIVESKEKLITTKAEINQYFRVLYQILKFVSTNCPNSTIKGLDFTVDNLIDRPCSRDEKLYTNMVRSFLTEDNYLVLAVNCYCETKTNTFAPYKALIERYSFLEHMPIKSKTIQNTGLMETILNHYSPLAFGSNPDYAKYQSEQMKTVTN